MLSASHAPRGVRNAAQPRRYCLVTAGELAAERLNRIGQPVLGPLADPARPCAYDAGDATTSPARECRHASQLKIVTAVQISVKQTTCGPVSASP